jgi:hypothetical protein
LPTGSNARRVALPGAWVFASGRQLAAWLGLVPGQNATGGKEMARIAWAGQQQRGGETEPHGVSPDSAGLDNGPAKLPPA